MRDSGISRAHAAGLELGPQERQSLCKHARINSQPPGDAPYPVILHQLAPEDKKEYTGGALTAFESIATVLGQIGTSVFIKD